MPKLTRVSARGTVVHAPAGSGSAASAGGAAASGSGGGKPAYAPEMDDGEDSDQVQVIDRVISPRKYAEIQQAYTALGKMINALPITKRQ